MLDRPHEEHRPQSDDSPKRLMEDWQALGLQLHLELILAKAADDCERRGIPPRAVLVTMDRQSWTPAYNEQIQVDCPLADGTRESFGFSALWTRYTEIAAIEPPSASILWVLAVRDRVLAWDLSGMFLMAPNYPEVIRKLGLFPLGQENLRNARLAAWERLSPKEHGNLLRDVLTSELIEPGKQSMPWRGLLISGGKHALDRLDGIKDPYRHLHRFDAALRLGRKSAIPESALRKSPPLECPLGKSDYRIYKDAPAPLRATSADIEDRIRDHTAPLPPKERAATAHFLRATMLDIDFKAYCRQHNLPYKSTSKAAERGMKNLRNES